LIAFYFFVVSISWTTTTVTREFVPAAPGGFLWSATENRLAQGILHLGAITVFA
jgi:hypothetical protein